MRNLSSKLSALRERAAGPYVVYVDQNNVSWRARRDGEGTMVKLNDPNFVHASEPLPQIRIGSWETDPFMVGILGIAAMEIFMIGSLVGSAFSY